MELVHAPVPELKGLLTHSFEDWAREGPPRASGQERLSCAISGGPPALLFLPALRAATVDWSAITLLWTDERAGLPDDPESNYGIADRMLLSLLAAKAPRAIRMPAEMPSLDEAASKYDDDLARELGDGALDLALVGVGEDGHVCGLFPGHKALTRDDRRVVAVEDAPRLPTRRLTLTLRFLLQSRKIWLIAVGPRKLPVLQAALSRTQRSTPLDLLMLQAKDVTVFTDQVIRRR